MTLPDQLMVHHIQVYKDKNIKKKLKELAELQDTDEKLAVIKNRITKGKTMYYIARERKLNSDIRRCRQAA